ncbi:MAG: MBL fold metallo-hydrolase [Clostridiales bacterium]|jgi:hydroxyacylglutathione hydrolase|nr:MBL fold metallo-hydrolase [Clostridiales bacterium]
MLIKTLTVGHLMTNCYIVTDENTLECAVIDPGAESGRILNYVEDNKLKVRYIFLTHGHYDHTTAVEELATETGAKIYIHKKDFTKDDPDAPYKFYSTAEVSHYGEDDILMLGSLEFRILETPGHSEGSVTLMCEDALFTGDTLFKDSCGRTDLGGGSMQILMKSLKRLYFLEGDYEVYPGHADPTTLSRERRFNEYMRYAVEMG